MKHTAVFHLRILCVQQHFKIENFIPIISFTNNVSAKVRAETCVFLVNASICESIC